MADLSIEQFPLIAAEEKALRYVTPLISTLNEALAVGQIPNPSFQNAKSDLNRAIEACMMMRGTYEQMARFAYTHEIDYTQANHIAGKVKKARKLQQEWDRNISPDDAPFTPLVKQFFGLAAEFTVLHEALESLKDKVIKRKVKTEEERAEQYTPPVPKTDAMREVSRILTNLTNDMTKQFAELLFNDFVRVVEHRLANPKKRGEKHVPSFSDNLMSKVGDNWDAFNGNYTSLKANWKQLLRRSADDDAKMVQQLFLYKNLTKLTEIIDRKGNLKSQSILSSHVSHMGFMGEIQYHFADGSEMTVRNKVVSKYSTYGTAFQQYPTTFHNVRTAKGQPFANASQERMIEVFAKQNGVEAK